MTRVIDIAGDEFVALHGCELGVRQQHVDREVDFVDDALAGAVTAGEQFQIFDGVVLPVAVAMVDGFVGQELAAKMLGHDPAVFEHRMLFTGHAGRDRNPDVSISAEMPRQLTGFGHLAKTLRAQFDVVFGFAFYVAVFLLRVYATARLAAVRVFLAAVETRKPNARLAFFAVRGASAGRRAVHRIFVEFLAVFGQVGRFVKERFAALFAGELDRRYLRSGPAVYGFMGRLAGLSTESACSFALASDFEGRAAMLAGQRGVSGFAPRFLAGHAAKARALLSGGLDGKRLSALFTTFLNRHVSGLSAWFTPAEWTHRAAMSIAVGG